MFLSIGYSTCHWCHVMAHESFENDEAARIINSNFIPVKVDREERPDVDAVYMAACMAMNGSGGWPLTVLMTPDKKPFWTGTYLTTKQLKALCLQAAELWQSERENILAFSNSLTEHIANEKKADGASPDRKLLEKGVSQLAKNFDAKWGGFGQAPKFPSAHNLLFLMRYAKHADNDSALIMAERTLEAMYRGGIFDHIGGGFSRYSTDGMWLVPHFEKMLYDNALLAMAYTDGYLFTDRAFCEKAARRTLDYVLAELTSDEGGFFCGQDADSEGVEGKYYLFTNEEIETVLNESEAEAFCKRFGITVKGNFEGKNIPNMIKTDDIDGDAEGMNEILAKLYEYRLKRTALHKDDKVLTAWNGLMIAAFARAGLVFGEESYINAAVSAVRFIKEKLTDSKGQLLARWRDGEAAHEGKLDDYAFFTWGLLELYKTVLDAEYLKMAENTALLMLRFFFDYDEGGFYPYSHEGEQLITRTREIYDGAMPSGNAAALLVLSRLARITAKEEFINPTQKHIGYMSGAVRDYEASHCFTLFALLEELYPSSELVCAAEEIPDELKAFLRDEAGENIEVVLKTKENAQMLEKIAPYTAEYKIEAQPTYYLCRNRACHNKVTDISKLKYAFENNHIN
ncbi:MAG: thioredoxin domain-containing protein [Clostridia bacterium]|nr:thioredoxin domain-containing protein [Clostridia bacterium]